MANQKKMVDDITSMDVDFSKWYTDIVKKAELMDYSSVKGCMIIQPYGYAIWENIQRELDSRFKATGHQNVYMPLFIPESLLQKEKDHVKGFAPEVAWVTEGGSEKLTERLCVRPTSEILFCEHYQKVLRRALGKDDAPVPALLRVPVAGGPHDARDRRGGHGGNARHAPHLRGVL